MKAGFFGSPEVGDVVKFRSSTREGLGKINKIVYCKNITYISVISNNIIEWAEILENYGK